MPKIKCAPNIPCPKCGAKPKELCTTKAGKPSYDMHSARWKAIMHHNRNSK